MKTEQIWTIFLALAISSPTLCENNQQIAHSSLDDVAQPSPRLDDPLAGSGTKLQITIDESWELDDVRKVSDTLYETANYIYSHLRNGPEFQIVVGHDNNLGPISRYRSNDEDFDRVLLSNTPLEYRPQIMYQFSHEFCHVISDFNRIRSTESKNEWFHEALCELASIFVLHSTDEPELKSYIDDYLEESREILSDIHDFGSWLLSNEDELRAQVDGRLDRKSNAVIAYRLHPLFARHPGLWNTLWHLPKSNSKIAIYIAEWKQAIDEQDLHLLHKVEVRLLGEKEQL